MKRLFVLILTSIFAITTSAQKQAFITSDIDNFWKAYINIIATTDSLKQYQFLKELYLDKASPGLKSLIESRNYTGRDYIDAINAYPAFWRSIKPNTLKNKRLFTSIEADINKLKLIYPVLKPVTIYFAIGVFKTNGTIEGNKILIGSELALADSTTKIDELPEWRKPFYKEYNPKSNVSLLCTHEYIHTQQGKLVENLLSKCLYEGVAEFISCLATGKRSGSPAIEFGKANQKKVISKFVEDLFIMSNDYNWLWGENRNELTVRDLGYYIGYEICECYYKLSKDKVKAIKELIELDYANEKEVERIVDATGLLPERLEKLYQDYEKSRPVVIAVTPFENGDQAVNPGLTKITVTFSEPLNGRNTGIDFGPLGKDHCPRISANRVWSNNGRSWTFEADLKPDQHYQILISNNFRKQNGIRLKPYLIEFKTTN